MLQVWRWAGAGVVAGKEFSLPTASDRAPFRVPGWVWVWEGQLGTGGAGQAGRLLWQLVTWKRKRGGGRRPRL